ELLARKALLSSLLREPTAGEPEPELATGILGETSRRQVLLDRFPRLRPEHPLVERRGLVEQRIQPLLALALRIRLRRRLLVLERHVEAVAEPLDRTDEVEPLGLAHERDRVAAHPAAEAVVRAAVGRD